MCYFDPIFFIVWYDICGPQALLAPAQRAAALRRAVSSASQGGVGSFAYEEILDGDHHHYDVTLEMRELKRSKSAPGKGGTIL